MCVIFLANVVRPTDEMIEKAWFHNDDGGGIAWRETSEENGTEVVWQKGITDVADMKKLIAEVPMPFVAHFRVASVGGIKKSLTHPFPIGEEASLALTGRTKGQVLFHNGHWGAWSDKALEAAIQSNSFIPSGTWSDTRAMAWMISIYGPGFMEFLPGQKGIIMTPKGMNIFTGNGWNDINGVWCSNDLFWTRGRVFVSTGSGNRLCNVGRCVKPVLPGKSVCYEHDKPAIVSSTPATAANGNTTALAPTGGTGNSLPFAVSEIITVAQAEILYRRGDISKALLKKFRREHQILESKSPKAIKAKDKLKEYTNLAKAKLLPNSHGRAH